MSYSEPEAVLGWRTVAYHPKGVRQLIEERFRIKIAYWEKDVTATEVSNGVFFSAFSSGPRAERVGIHYDDPAGWAMLLIYLTPGASHDCGTSFWQHRATGLVEKPTRRDADRLNVSLAELEALLDRDGRHYRRWLEIDRVGNIYNRAIMFPSGVFHSATRHFGNNPRNGRLYQSFHFPVSNK